jgi:hypothetical protein
VGDHPNSGHVVVTPGTARLTLQGQAPEVVVTRWEDFVSGGRWRRRAFGLVGGLSASVDLTAAVIAGTWVHGLSAAGVMLDMAGASLLTTGLILPYWGIYEMAAPRTNMSQSIRNFWDQARLDAYVAVFLLGGGFALQALSTACAARP